MRNDTIASNSYIYGALNQSRHEVIPASLLLDGQPRAIKLWGTVVLGICWSLAVIPEAGAIVNGDLETGDLTGWTVSAFDDSDNPVTPLANVTTVGSNSFVQMSTGDFATGPFIQTLEQTFDFTSSAPVLMFDFGLPVAQPDPTGTGTSPFNDAWIVSVDDGIDLFELLLIDSLGALPDPFGTAPGTVALAPSPDPFFDFSFSADLSSLGGQPITIFIDVINENDGFLSNSFTADNFKTKSLEEPKSVVPEPSVLVLHAVGSISILLSLRRKV